jgi:hypothetical protein
MSNINHENKKDTKINPLTTEDTELTEHKEDFNFSVHSVTSVVRFRVF